MADPHTSPHELISFLAAGDWFTRASLAVRYTRGYARAPVHGFARMDTAEPRSISPNAINLLSMAAVEANIAGNPDEEQDEFATLPLSQPFAVTAAAVTDLLHDMGSSERSCVDGESLLVEALSAPRVSSGTPISVIAALEKLLVSLTSVTQNVAQFDVVFFKAYEPVWAASAPEALGLRRLVIAHLQAAGVPVVIFDGLWSDGGFSAYLRREQPSFMLLSDAVAADGNTHMPPCFQQVASMAGGLLVFCLAQSIDVAYMSSLAFDPITVFGFLATAEKSSIWAKGDLPFYNATAAEIVEASSKALQLPASSLPAEQLPQLVGELSSWRLAAGVCSLATSQQEEATLDATLHSWLSQVWLAHLVLLRCLPLEQRALRDLPGLTQLSALQQEPRGSVAQFVARTTRLAAGLVPAFPACLARSGDWAHAGTWHAGSQAASDIQLQLRAELADSYDIRLFHSLLLLACAQQQPCSLGLPPAAEKEWLGACSALQRLQAGSPAAVAAAAGAASLPMAPAALHEELTALLAGSVVSGLTATLAQWQQAAAVQRAQPVADRTYDAAVGNRLLKDSFVSSVLQQCPAGEAPAAGAGAGAGTGAGAVQPAGALQGVPAAYHPLFAAQKPFRNPHHWHVKKELQPAFVSEATDESEVLKHLLKQVDIVPLEELSTLKRIRRGKVAQIDRLLSQADEYKKNNPHDTRIHELQVQARQVARSSIEDSINRQKQMDARAMGRMIASLEGEAKFGASARGAGKGHAKQAEGAGGKEGGKAAAIRLANLMDKRKAALQEQLGLWATAEAKVLAWAGSYSSAQGWTDPATVQGVCLAPVDAFMAAHTDLQPEVQQVALGTKLLVLFHAIRERLKLNSTLTSASVAAVAVSGANGTTNGEASTAAATGVDGQQQQQAAAQPGELDEGIAKLLVELVVAVQAIKALPASVLLTPVLETFGSDSKGAEKDKDKSKDKEKSSKDKEKSSKDKDKSSKDKDKSSKGKEGDDKGGKGKDGATGGDPAAGAGSLIKLPWQPNRSTTALAAVLATLQSLGFGEVSSRLVEEVAGKAATAGASGDGTGQAPAKPSKGSSKAKATVSGVGEGAAEKEADPAAAAATSAMQAAAAALKLKSVPVGFCPVRFQLRYMGHLLERPVSGAQDQRVHGFRPDPWQQRLLDAVDKGSSCVISAPTSSGKTFIASYVIARVLGESEAGRAVIVLPTKALVNQLSAQVQKDFGPVFGVFTRDFRNNIDGCRVLITVPECLETLVLASGWQEQMSRVRYLILDEVHCMNERGSGEVWERLMMTARCPILALSATIGNPEAFAGWLRRAKALAKAQDMQRGPAHVQPAEHYDVHLIEHKERYNDLQYHVHVATTEPMSAEDPRQQVLPPNPLGPVWTAGGGPPVPPQQPDHEVMALHPIGSIDLRAETSPSGPQGTCRLEDMSLAPQEALLLYDTMLKEAEAGPQDSSVLSGLRSLDPAANLGPGAKAGGKVLLTRPDTKAWSRMLCVQAADWCRSGPEGLEAMLRVQHALCGALESRMELYDGASGTMSDTPHGLPAQLDHVAPMLLGLSKRGMLPALVFNFDRRACERYAERLVGELEMAEQECRDKYAKRLQAERDRIEVQAAAAAEAAKAAAKCKKGEGDEEGAGLAGQRSAPFKIIDGITFSTEESQPDPSFTFMMPNKMGSALLAETIENLSDVLSDGPHTVLLRALSRGIGVHHSGLHTRYRQAVEMLFRSRILQVVIATGTLAYGIHMPCRTVVMAGDSIFLDALNFRQMSGRAGRRGLDTLGHCVFYHLPMHKVHRLRAAPLPQLRGQNLLSPTLTLRMLMMSRQLQDRQQATNKKIPVGGAGAPPECMASSIIQASFLNDALTHKTATQPLTTTIISKTAAASKGGSVAVSGQADSLRQQLLHTFCMSVRQLMEAKLVNKDGEPCGLAGLASHLYWTAPANLALTRLLSSGALHHVCNEQELQGQQGAAAALERLMLVMAHLFVRQPLPSPLTAKHMQRAAASHHSPSLVVLPALPEVCQEVIQEYNTEVLTTSVRCIIAYAAGLLSGAGGPVGQAERRMRDEDATLPLSSLAHAAPLANGDTQAQAQEQGGLVGSLLCPSSALKLDVSAASPFCCLTGRGDTYDNVAEVMASLKHRLHISPAAIPVLELRNRHGFLQPLNAFAYDYLRHGLRQPIVDNNKIAEGDAWELLRGLQGVLQALAVSLEQLLDPGEAGDDYDEEERQGAGGGWGRHDQAMVQAFKKLSETFTAKFSAFNARR